MRAGICDRLLSGPVGVEQSITVSTNPAQKPRLFGSEGRALRRDHVFHAVLEGAEQVELALANHGGLGSMSARFDLSRP